MEVWQSWPEDVDIGQLLGHLMSLGRPALLQHDGQCSQPSKVSKHRASVSTETEPWPLVPYLSSFNYPPWVWGNEWLVAGYSHLCVVWLCAHAWHGRCATVPKASVPFGGLLLGAPAEPFGFFIYCCQPLCFLHKQEEFMAFMAFSEYLTQPVVWKTFYMMPSIPCVGSFSWLHY